MDFCRRLKQRVFLTCSLLALPAWCDESASEAPSSTECVADYQEAQVRQAKNELVQAVEPLKRCLHPQCSSLLREACGVLLDQVEADIPSIVLVAKAEGADLLDVTVYEGDRLVAARLGGQPIELNPGPYEFRFEAEGRKAIHQAVVLRTGEKNRLVAAEWLSVEQGPPAVARPEVAPAETHHSSRSESPSWLRPSDAIPWGLGVAFGVSGALMAVAAQNDFKEAQATCAPFCSSERLNSIHAKSVVADSLFVLAGVAFAVGTFRILARDHGEKSSVSLIWGPRYLGARADF